VGPAAIERGKLGASVKTSGSWEIKTEEEKERNSQTSFAQSNMEKYTYKTKKEL